MEYGGIYDKKDLFKCFWANVAKKSELFVLGETWHLD